MSFCIQIVTKEIPIEIEKVIQFWMHNLSLFEMQAYHLWAVLFESIVFDCFCLCSRVCGKGRNTTALLNCSCGDNLAVQIVTTEIPVEVEKVPIQLLWFPWLSIISQTLLQIVIRNLNVPVEVEKVLADFDSIYLGFLAWIHDIQGGEITTYKALLQLIWVLYFSVFVSSK